MYSYVKDIIMNLNRFENEAKNDTSTLRYICSRLFYV